jgi:hypothetical protein
MKYQMTNKQFLKMCKYYHDDDLDTDDKKNYNLLWTDYMNGKWMSECDESRVPSIIEYYLSNKKEWTESKIIQLLNDIETVRNNISSK